MSKRLYTPIVVVLVFTLLAVFFYRPKEEVKAAAIEVALGETVEEVDLLITREEIDLKKNRIQRYTSEELYNLDLTQPSGVTAEDLAKVLKLGLEGLEDSFVQAEKDYGINCVFLASIAALESYWGTMLFRPNNMFGYGSYSFSSKEECIDFVARGIANNYLSPDGGLYYGNTARAVNTRYASNPLWYAKVGNFMKQMYDGMQLTDADVLTDYE